MNSKLTIFFFIILSTSFQAIGQEYWKNWDAKTLAQVEQASSLDSYTEQEKQVAFVINLLRVDPMRFMNEVLIPFVDDQQIPKEKAYKSLLRELRKTEPLPLLEQHPVLYDAAKFHAKDMGRSGKTGHRSSKGKSFEKRMSPLLDTFASVGENCHYGSNDALLVVIDLLIDRGIPGYGHRKNLLQADFVFIGISMAPHKKYEVNCVQEFAGKLN